MKKPPEGRNRSGKPGAGIYRHESKEDKRAVTPDTIRTDTFREIISRLPQIFEDYRYGQIKPHNREFLVEIESLRFKPAIELMLAMEMREGKEGYLSILTRYIDQIYTQYEIGPEDIRFLKEVFRYAQQKQNFEAIGPAGIDPKYGEMTVEKIIEEVFRYRKVLHLKSELVSALWHAVNRGV